MKKFYIIFLLVLSFIYINNVDAKTITENLKGYYYYDEAFSELKQMNKEREKVGAPTLKMDKDLFIAAQLRAAEIAVYFSHTRPTGKPWSSVSSKAFGENILWSSNSGAQEATTLWMNSQGHRENMLQARYNSVGIGCFKYNNVYYWVQLFGYKETDNELKTAPKNETKTVAVELEQIPDKVTFEENVYYIDKVGDSIIIKFNTEPADIDSIYEVYSKNGYIDVSLVNDELKVTAKKEGYEEIMVYYSDDVYAIASIVIGKRQESISLDKNYYEVEVGKYLEAKPIITPNDAIKTYFVKAKEPDYFSGLTTDGTSFRLYAAKTGTTEIVITTADGKYSFTATVKITPSTTIDSISLDKTNIKLAKGSSTTLTASISPIETILDKTIIWSSSNTDIAIVDENGKVTGISPGVCTITATTSNGLKATSTITVEKINVKDLIIDNIANQVYTGKTLKPSVKIIDNDKELVLNSDYTLSYKNNKNIGSATITITGLGEYTGSISKTFKIIAGTPKKLVVSKQDKSSITVKWSKPSGSITGYELYYSTKKDTGYKKITTTTKTSYKKTGLSAGKTYYFKIRSYKTISGKKYYSSYTTYTIASTTPAKPTIKLSGSTNTVKLSWKKVSGATGYEVYQSTDKKKYTKVGTTRDLSLIVNNLSSAKTYYYKVRAVKEYNSTNIKSSYSKVVSITTKPVAPVVNYKIGKTYISFNLNKVSRASGYEIYMATSKTGKYSKIKTMSSLSYKKTGLKANKTYYFKIRSYKNVSGKKIYSSYVTILITTNTKVEEVVN